MLGRGGLGKRIGLDLAGVIFYLQDGSEVRPPTLVGQNAIDGGQVGHFYFTAAEGEGEAKAGGVFPGSDAHLPAHLDHPIYSQRGKNLNGGHVVGRGKGNA